jgi:hypothetical protein
MLPFGMITGIVSDSEGERESGHKCDFGITTVAPLVEVKSSRATMVPIPIRGRGRGREMSPSSVWRCCGGESGSIVID